jgi:hypothetical protein
MKLVQTFINSNIGPILVGFVLTTVIGGFFGAWLQGTAWERQTQAALFQKRYEEGTKFLDDLSDLIGKRYFFLQRLVWRMEDPELGDVEKAFQEYDEVVKDWNVRLRTFRNKARLLIGEEFASLFLDYADDGNQEQPRSLHYRFVKAHRMMLAAKEGKIKAEEADQEVGNLNDVISLVIEQFATEFLNRARKLELLEVPAKTPSARPNG